MNPLDQAMVGLVETIKALFAQLPKEEQVNVLETLTESFDIAEQIAVLFEDLDDEEKMEVYTALSLAVSRKPTDDDD